MVRQPRPLQSCTYLTGVTLRRLFRSRQTVVSLLLLGFAVLVVIAWSLRRERTAVEFVEQILLPVYVSFLLPIFCLCYGVASISSDREEQTLVYLLVTPLPRPLIYFGKFSAALLLALAWTLGGMAILCAVSGSVGWEPFQRFWPAVLLATFAYVSLFHLLSAVFRRATIIALVYTLFLETVLGNMPGIVKRVAITFYTRCLIFDAGESLGVGPAGGQNPALFLPLSGQTAFVVLCVLAATFFLLGMWQFSRREYV
jgi:ABC-type transport system involved in multi-copper enzyme maturation permease subunit